MKSYDIQRIVFGLPIILLSFIIIILDAAGIIDITKFGYAAFGTWITLILQFYFRKAGTEPEVKP